jgi:hypothetical protein
LAGKQGTEQDCKKIISSDVKLPESYASIYKVIKATTAAAILLLLFSGNNSFAQIIGKAISLESDVKIVRGSVTTNAKPSENIGVGDVVLTGTRSSARFLMNDSTIIDIKESSRFVFDKLNTDLESREAEFSLDFGKVRASVNRKIQSGKQYKIKTKATVFAVRGTDFTVSESASGTNLTVFEGNVLGSGNGIEEAVSAGVELALNEGIAKRKSLSKAEVDAVFAASRAEDMTFTQSLVIGDFRVSRNFGSSTVNAVSKLVATPLVQIPASAFKVPGINPLNASAVSPGILNYVITNIGVKIQ